MTYKEIKKKHNFSDGDIAEYFGYANSGSFARSSANKRIKTGIEKLYAKLTENTSINSAENP